MPETAETEVKDYSHRFNVAVGVLGTLTAGATLSVGLTTGAVNLWSRVALFSLGAATAVVGFFKVRNESRYKQYKAEVQESLENALKVVVLRNALLMNGAMLGTVDKLRELAAQDAGGRALSISGIRQSVVSKVCDLVKSDRPRAAYFRVQDLGAQQQRVMMRDCSDSRSRTDEFTSTFVEGAPQDSNVWALIDRGDAHFSANIAETVPEGFDTERRREYASYVSVAVRAGGIPFGMLTANTIETDGFTADSGDIDAVRVLARLLATAELIALSPTKAKALPRSGSSP
ncbi:hypothetical protein [Mycobacteroides abscessus]|uniref:hypothetical protein n=1 Tax=Mycobacteroides abscessus TaxID=36809 RepID=UPI000C2637CB|nr:hypothetical protein [Mycobacteroides abscessus]MBN7374157.1 hypothetical protein [Mycobacteroides abscessus subsp. abscessus]RIR16429.1 hypothetical protein D2E41_26225 [Mycobacteroides abscessus]